MKVVLPSPDSPATYSNQYELILMQRAAADHNGEGSTSLGDDFVSLVGQIGNAYRRRRLDGRRRHAGSGRHSVVAYVDEPTDVRNKDRF